MTTTTTNEIIENLKSEIQVLRNTQEERNQRVGRGETDYDDCFMSMRSEQLQIQLLNTKIAILEEGGTRPFPCLRDLETGEVVTTTLVNGQFGLVWIIDEQFKPKFGTFVGNAKRESTYTKKGLVTSEVELPVGAKIVAGGGGGLMGAYTSSVVVYPLKNKSN